MDTTAFAGRRLHFIAIGGAGMSALALVAHALGAEVTGSDRAESTYLAPLRELGIEPVIGHSAAGAPSGAEVVRATAVPDDNPELAGARAAGARILHRADLLAEIVAAGRSIAVSGTHGKTTTSAMVTHALLEAGRDPAYLIGGRLRSSDRNAAWGGGGWIVVEADESDRSFLKLAPEVAVITNAELDHHATYRSLADLEAAMARFGASAPTRIVWEGLRLELPDDGRTVTFGLGAGDIAAEDLQLRPFGSRFRVEGVEVELPVPGRHNVLNALAALAACREAGIEPAEAAAGLATFGGTGRRFEPRGRTSAGAEVYDDYAHHPTEVRATLEAARTLGAGRVVACFQPHLFSRTRHLAREFGAALALADVVVVLEIYPSRENAEDYPGVSGHLVAAAAADHAGGRPVYWTPRMADAETLLRGELHEGDALLTLGAGDVDRLAETLTADDGAGPRGRGSRPDAVGTDAEAPRAAPGARAEGPRRGDRPVSNAPPPAGVELDFPLARLTTVRTGGPADFFARARTREELAELLRWADDRSLAVGPVGSGSNLLVADAGFRGLALKLEGGLAAIEREGERLCCGGGARLPQAAARAAREGLAGLEFGVNIPGTVGGAVRMNANAYGGDLSRVLEWAEVVTAAGSERRAPAELGFAYRRSSLSAAEIVAHVSFRLEPAEPEGVKRTLADMRSRRRAAQPSGIKTFGSTFKNPDDPRAEGRSAGVLLDAAGCRGLELGGARFSDKHANFVENTGEATTAAVIALMAEGRRRVREHFGVALEPEVQILGDLDVDGLFS